MLSSTGVATSAGALCHHGLRRVRPVVGGRFGGLVGLYLKP